MIHGKLGCFRRCKVKLVMHLFHNKTLLKNLVDGSEFQYRFEKSCLSHKLFVTLFSVAVSLQKGRSRVNKCFM